MPEFYDEGKTIGELLSEFEHDGIDHTTAPHNLLDGTTHDARDHSALGSVLSPIEHDIRDHSSVPGLPVPGAVPVAYEGASVTWPYSVAVPATTLDTDGDSIEFEAFGTFTQTVAATADAAMSASIGAASAIPPTTQIGGIRTGSWRVVGKIVRTAVGTGAINIVFTLNDQAGAVGNHDLQVSNVGSGAVDWTSGQTFSLALILGAGTWAFSRLATKLMKMET